MSGAHTTAESRPARGELDPSSLVVVVPAFNEAGAIGSVVRDLTREWPRVVVVDDGSSDDTGSAALAAGATVLSHVVNRGQGAALQTGLAYGLRSGAEFIVTFDADGQHRTEEIGRLVEPLVNGDCDVVLGSRFLEAADDVPLLRRLLLRCAVVFTRITSGLALTDTHNGLRGLSRHAAAAIDLRVDRMAHASEILDQIAALGLSYREVPVRIRYTRYSLVKGQSGLAAARVLLDYLLARVFN